MSTKLKAGTASSGVVIDADTSGILELQTGSTPTTAITVDTAQNVGIGTSSPSAKLNAISSSSANNYLTADIQNSAATSTTAFNNRLVRIASNASGADATLQFTDFTAYNAYIGLNGGNLLFGTNGPTERMRIDSSGNLLVNATSNGGNGKVYVTNTNDCVKTFTSGSSGFGIVCQTAYTSSNGNLLAFVNSGGGIVGTITTNNSNTAYNTSSDYRLKDNVAPMTGCLEKVSKLKPVTYRWIESGLESQGFIAHELQEIVPEAVTGKKDAVNEDGSIKPQGIDTSFLVATLTAAIQELNAKVDAQALEIQALKGAA